MPLLTLPLSYDPDDDTPSLGSLELDASRMRAEMHALVDTLPYRALWPHLVGLRASADLAPWVLLMES